jgi:hypothetical protein
MRNKDFISVQVKHGQLDSVQFKDELVRLSNQYQESIKNEIIPAKGLAQAAFDASISILTMNLQSKRVSEISNSLNSKENKLSINRIEILDKLIETAQDLQVASVDERIKFTDSI